MDPEAARQWKRAGETESLLLALAGSLPDVLADATFESWQLAQGVDKRALAGISAASWWIAAHAVTDHLRSHCPSVPQITRIPEQIERLQKIERG